MNDQEKKNFDEVLKSKLANHTIQPTKDLMPGILDKIGGSAGNGSSSGITKYWPFILVGFGLLGFWGYTQYSGASETSNITTQQNDISKKNSFNPADEKSNEISSKKTEGVEKSYDPVKENGVRATINDQKTDAAQLTEEASSAILSNDQSESLPNSVSSYIDKKGLENSVNTQKEQIYEKTNLQKKTVNVKKNSTVVLSKPTTDSIKKQNSLIDNSESGTVEEVIQAKSGESTQDNLPANSESSESLDSKDVLSGDPGLITVEQIILNNANEQRANSNLEDNSSIGAINSDESAGAVDDFSNSENVSINGSNENLSESSDINTALESSAAQDPVETVADANEQEDELIASQAQDSDSALVPESDQNIELLPLIESKWSFDLLAGPSYNYRILDFENNRELENHKNEFESSIVTYSYAAIVRRQIRGKWSANLGFMYLQMGEKYEFANDVVSHSAVNEYNYYSILLGIEYDLLSRNKIDLIGGLGAQMNFLSKGTSSWLDPQSFSAQVHTHEDTSSPFSDQTFAWNAKVGLRYKLSSKVDIILEEQGLLFNSSVYKKNTGLNQREYSFKTFLGVGIKF